MPEPKQILLFVTMKVPLNHIPAFVTRRTAQLLGHLASGHHRTYHALT
jgi:hypothetical protein